jgi:hypothetical protein
LGDSAGIHVCVTCGPEAAMETLPSHVCLWDDRPARRL